MPSKNTDGRVSIIPRPSARPATCEDLKITDAKPTLPQSDVIIDGKIMTNNLKSVRKSREWLLEELKKRNKNHKDILLATSDYDGNLTIMTKRWLQKNTTATTESKKRSARRRVLRVFH